MMVRRVTVTLAGLCAVLALAGCAGDPEPTAQDYRAAHVAFWTIAAQVAQEDTGRAPRADLEQTLNSQWDDPSQQAPLKAIYDGVCEDLRDHRDKPDLILALVDKLAEQGVSRGAAEQGVLKQSAAVAKHLCPSQAGTVDSIKDKVLKS